MVAIRPFRALCYDPALVGDLSRVIAPPYDVIDPQGQERLYQASPYNIVRLILGKESAADTEQDSRYTRARRDFQAWREGGIFRRDQAPALYLVAHAFGEEADRRTRLGFIAVLELNDSTLRSVYRHEATLAGPKADRTKLLEALPASLEPIFCVYPDAGGTTQAFLQELTRRTAPAAQAAINGEEIRLWAVTEPATVQRVTAALESTAVLIADGHHRFEVAFAHRSRYAGVMSYFVSMEDPALLVRPIHRVVAHPRSADIQALRMCCRLEPARDLPEVLQWLGDPGSSGPVSQSEQGRFGYADGRALYRVTLNPEPRARWLMAPPVPLPLAALDVSILHGLILPTLGVVASHVHAGGEERVVRYTADAAQALETVTRGEARSAWLLRAIPLPQVYALAAQGLSLPPKSTYFYPKVPSGLTINPFD